MKGVQRLRVLGWPAYRRLWIGRTVSLVGDGIAPVALAFAVLDLTGSASDLGIALAARSIVVIALVLVGGVIADRISPRLAMLGADLARVVSPGLIAAHLLSGTAAIWELALLFAIDGAATALFNPASVAIRPVRSPRRAKSPDRSSVRPRDVRSFPSGPAPRAALVSGFKPREPGRSWAFF